MMSTFLNGPNTFGTTPRRSEQDFDLISCRQPTHTTFVASCLLIIRAYAVLWRICRGTTKVVAV